MAEQEKNVSVVVNPPKIMSDAEIAALTANASTNLGFFGNIGLETGVIDSPLKAGEKMETDEVVNRALHIDVVHITRAVGDDGSVSDFPVLAFAEMPGKYYMAGKRCYDIVMVWAKATGDDCTIDSSGCFAGNRLLPKLNAAFLEHGAPCIVLKKKKGKRNEYVDVLLLGG